MARAELAGSLALAMLGCGDPPGPLDRDVVHDLARDVGSAEGTGWSGAYVGELRTLACECPSFDALNAVSRCSVAGEIGELTETLGVLHSDGVVVFRQPGDTLTGAVEADGSFSVGSIRDATTSLTRGSIITRIDGVFGPDGIEAELQTRLAGEVLLFDPDTSGETDESFDCIERLSMSVAR